MLRHYINLVESAQSEEPAWVTQIFSLQPHARETFDIGGVSLDVAAFTVSLSDDENGIGLKHIEVSPEARGQGKASAIFQELVRAADRYGRPLELSAYPYEERRTDAGRATPEQVEALVHFYERFGFVAQSANFNYPVTMIYRPAQNVAEAFKDHRRCTAFTIRAIADHHGVDHLIPDGAKAPLEGIGVLQHFPKIGLKATGHFDQSYRGRTVRDFVADHPTGAHYISTAGHAMAVTDGKLHDASGRGPDRRKVQSHFEIKLRDQ